MFTAIRKAVGGKRKRLEDDDGLSLDLTYVTPRIIAMSYPASGFEKVGRNPIENVSAFLKKRHNRKYWIFNVSERHNYNGSEFLQGHVSRYHWPDHHAPTPFAFIALIVDEAEKWLKKDPANVIVVHCNSGKGRTGSIISALMFYLGLLLHLFPYAFFLVVCFFILL